MKSAQEIFTEAASTGRTAAAVAISYEISPNYNMWPEIQENPSDGGETYSTISLTSESRKDLLSRYALSVARSVQFPPNTSFMHLIGCVSSAMARNFTVEYHGTELPISMYVVTSQPPSSGKSAVNSMHVMPIKAEFDRISEKAIKQIAKINFRLEELKKTYKEATNQNEKQALSDDMARENEKLEKIYPITYPVTDGTPEAIQLIANAEGGFFSIISDEATALNTALGLSYGADGSKSNAEIVLKGWDGGFVGTARIGRGLSSGNILGNISVIAQDESIESILSAGERGNGLTERFLMLREPPMIGQRKHWDYENDRPAYEPVAAELKAEYARFVHAVIEAGQIKLKLSKMAQKMLAMHRDRWEENFRDGGKWEHALLRGAMGKADKHITRLAAIFHVADNWNDGGKRSFTINDESMSRAIAVYEALTKTFTDAVESRGYAGEKSEIELISERLRKQIQQKRDVVTVKWLYDSLKKVKPFSGIPQLYARLKDVVLPGMECAGYCVVSKGKVYISPRLK